MTAYFVNGDAIRDLQFVDFALGGNDQIYGGRVEGKPLLCEPGVFIIDRTNADEAPFILLHESIERRKMADGLSYDNAHDYANIYGEEVARADPSKLPDMLAAEGWTVDKTVANYALLKADWEEAKHPRDQKGEFASEGGGNNSNNMGQEDPKKQLPRTVDLTNVKSWDDITKEFDKAIDDVTFSVESHGNTYTGMSKIRTNKVSIYFNKTTRNSAESLAGELEFFKRNNGEKIFNKLLAPVSQIVITDNSHSQGSHVISTGGRGSITVYGNNNIDAETLIHEVAHNIKSQDEIRNAFGEFVKQGELSPTGYGRSNIDEDIAETFKTYFFDPETLRNDYNKRYQFVKEWLDE
jgi:hypothetical protein